MLIHEFLFYVYPYFAESFHAASTRVFSRGKTWENSDGDVVSPRFTPWRGWTEKDSWCRRAKWPGRPRGRRKHTSWRVVSFVPLATFFTGDVAERYGDQDGYGDPHAYADPDDLLIYATVALSWNEAGFILHSRVSLYASLLHLNIKWHSFLVSGETFR